MCHTPARRRTRPPDRAFPLDSSSPRLPLSAPLPLFWHPLLNFRTRCCRPGVPQSPAQHFRQMFGRTEESEARDRPGGGQDLDVNVRRGGLVDGTGARRPPLGQLDVLTLVAFVAALAVAAEVVACQARHEPARDLGLHRHTAVYISATPPGAGGGVGAAAEARARGIIASHECGTLLKAEGNGRIPTPTLRLRISLRDTHICPYSLPPAQYSLPPSRSLYTHLHRLDIHGDVFHARRSAVIHR